MILVFCKAECMLMVVVPAHYVCYQVCGTGQVCVRCVGCYSVKPATTTTTKRAQCPATQHTVQQLLGPGNHLQTADRSKSLACWGALINPYQLCKTHHGVSTDTIMPTQGNNTRTEWVTIKRLVHGPGSRAQTRSRLPVTNTHYEHLTDNS